MEDILSFIGKNIVINTETLTPLSADPASPTTGMLYYSNGTPRAAGLWQYNGSAWAQVGSGGLIPTYANKSSNYAITNTDNLGDIWITGVGAVITLPQASANIGRVITIKKNVSSNTANIVTPFSGDAIETLAANASINLDYITETVTLRAIVAGTWEIVSWMVPQPNTQLLFTTGDWTGIISTAVFYKDPLSQVWRMRFNVGGSVTNALRSNYVLTISYIITAAGGGQAVSTFEGSTGIAATALMLASNNVISVFHSPATTSGYYFSGDVLLAGKPTSYVL